MGEPQTPRDLSTNAEGDMTPKAATLTDEQANFLPLVNVHFHLGAEHKSDSYNDGTDSEAYDAQSSGRRLAANPRPGWMCPTDTLTSSQLTSYNFQYCEGVEVGKSYEVHYVHSSAGVDVDMTDGVNADDLADGLGGREGKVCQHTFARKMLSEENGERKSDRMNEVCENHETHLFRGFLSGHFLVCDFAKTRKCDVRSLLFRAANGRGILNPMVVVQGQVYQIVSGGPVVDDLLHGWTVVGHDNSVMYPGSTTGQSWDNSVCSPYAITWHVDKDCHQVSPESFDNLCKMMKEQYNMVSDLKPHGSRILVDRKYVVKAEYVKPLA
eukprot:Skav220248  [mRNA]  locus=scaffold4467:25103:28283:- [translate_table: standard]